MSRPDYWKDCTIECERIVRCKVCSRIKKPVGRDLAPAMAGSRCDQDCPGYGHLPMPGHLWPGELAAMDAKEEA